MKALTIQQPYASLIADGEKWVENRNWFTRYRGPLAIHAGKRSRYLRPDNLRNYATGCVIATCNLAACVLVAAAEVDLVNGEMPADFDRLGWGEAELAKFLDHQHTEGPYGFILQDVRNLAVPVPAIGKQGLWEWDERNPT